MSDPEVVLAVDVGGTKVLGALIAPDGAVVREYALPSRTARGVDPGSEVTLAVVRELLSPRVTAVGAGFPEYVRNGLLTAHEVVDWVKQPGDLIRELAPGRPVVIESDVRCGALAEAVLGAGAGHRSVLYVSWGTGLSSTLVLDGACVKGARGEAIALGELGVPGTAVAPGAPGAAVALGATGPAGAVGAAWEGNLERFASGLGMAERYTELTGIPVPGAREVMAADDDAARQVVESAGLAMGTVLDWLVSLLDPGVIVLGGGLGSSHSAVTRITAETFALLGTRRPGGPSLVPASLGPRAGVIGAALAAKSAS